MTDELHCKARRQTLLRLGRSWEPGAPQAGAGRRLAGCGVLAARRASGSVGGGVLARRRRAVGDALAQVAAPADERHDAKPAGKRADGEREPWRVRVMGD